MGYFHATGVQYKMGMDLIPRNAQIESFHTNWTGWRYISGILIQLEVDVEKLSGSNDGVYIKARTAKSWGCAMLDALEQNRIRNAIFGDKTYFSNFRDEPIVFEEPVKEEVSKAILTLSFECPGYEELVYLDEGDKIWLREFANFCISSKGFRQC